MPDKISELPSEASPVATNELAIVKDATTKRITIQKILDLVTHPTQAPSLFHAYDAGGGITLNTTGNDLTWDTEVRKDSDFTHTADSAEITLGAAGWYKINVECTFDAATSTIDALMKIQEDVGAGYVDIAHALAGTFCYSTTNQYGNAVITIVRQFAVNDKVKVVVFSESNESTITYANSARILIELLETV